MKGPQPPYNRDQAEEVLERLGTATARTIAKELGWKHTKACQALKELYPERARFTCLKGNLYMWRIVP